MSKVIPFPAKITAEAKLRSCRRTVAHLEEQVVSCDPRSPSVAERVTAGIAPMMLEEWRERLREAEYQAALWQNEHVLSHGGVDYPQIAGRA